MTRILRRQEKINRRVKEVAPAVAAPPPPPPAPAAGPALAVPGAALAAPETGAARVAFTAVVEQAIVLLVVVPLSRPAPGPSHHVG